jgi:hypothetical protein
MSKLPKTLYVVPHTLMPSEENFDGYARLSDIEVNGEVGVYKLESVELLTISPKLPSSKGSK